MTGWPLCTIGIAFAGAAVFVAGPAQACSCISPDNLERAGRAALASADLAAELEVGRAPAPPRLYCAKDGHARPWFRPGQSINRDYPARVIRIIKGRVSGPIRLRDNPTRSANGYCSIMVNSCQVGVQPGLTGPMLLTRVAPNVFRPVSVCTQAAFADWYARRRPTRRTAG